MKSWILNSRPSHLLYNWLANILLIIGQFTYSFSGGIKRVNNNVSIFSFTYDVN